MIFSPPGTARSTFSISPKSRCRLPRAQRSRAPIQRFADRVSAVFVPAVLLIAVATAIVWGVAGPEPRLAHALVNAVAVLIIACPCALGLATPMSIMVTTGRGASLGVLIRKAEALEALERVDTIVVDKTGTLTEGKPRLASIVTIPGTTEDSTLALAAALERSSEHPLAFVRPRGLITDSAVATRRTAIAAAASAISWTRSPCKAPPVSGEVSANFATSSIGIM